MSIITINGWSIDDQLDNSLGLRLLLLHHHQSMGNFVPFNCLLIQPFLTSTVGVSCTGVLHEINHQYKHRFKSSTLVEREDDVTKHMN